MLLIVIRAIIRIKWKSSLSRFVIHITLPYLPYPDVLSVDYSALSRHTIWTVPETANCNIYQRQHKVLFRLKLLEEYGYSERRYFVTMAGAAHGRRQRKVFSDALL